MPASKPVAIDPDAATRIVAERVDSALLHRGWRPLSDHAASEVAAGDAVVIRAHESSDDVAVLTRAGSRWQIELLAESSTATVLLAAAVELVRSSGGGMVDWWTFRSDDAPGDAAVARSVGLALSREQWQMRVALPLSPTASTTSTVSTRAFRPGLDDTEWLAVNNAAFADHAEQGTWTLDTLRRRVDESWFDPEGFRIHDRDGRIAAFCWTKRHETTSHEPAMGEIYVIAVRPDLHGHGLGRSMTVAGLHHLAAAGLTTGMLHVAADNIGAVALYRSLGMTTHHIDRAYSAVLSPDANYAAT